MRSTLTLLTLGWMLVVAVIAAAGCGGSADSGPTEDATIDSLKLLFDGGSLPPEFHTSSTITVVGDTVTRTAMREYGDVVESETTIEMDPDQRVELERLIRDADLREVELVDENCTGGGSVGITILWSDETEISGGQDQGTYRNGPGGQCNRYTLAGDLVPVVDYLRSL